MNGVPRAGTHGYPGTCWCSYISMSVLRTVHMPVYPLALSAKYVVLILNQSSRDIMEDK